MVGTILRILGQSYSDKILKELVREVDTEGNTKQIFNVLLQAHRCNSSFQFKKKRFSGRGRLEFHQFTNIAEKFIVEEDTEALQKELKEAFRLYDKEGKKKSFGLQD